MWKHRIWTCISSLALKSIMQMNERTSFAVRSLGRARWGSALMTAPMLFSSIWTLRISIICLQWFTDSTISRKICVRNLNNHNVIITVLELYRTFCVIQHGVLTVLEETTQPAANNCLSFFLSSLLHLHWLDIPERINCKLNVTVHRCLQEKASMYLVDCCRPVSEVSPAVVNYAQPVNRLNIILQCRVAGWTRSGLFGRWSNTEFWKLFAKITQNWIICELHMH